MPEGKGPTLGDIALLQSGFHEKTVEGREQAMQRAHRRLLTAVTALARTKRGASDYAARRAAAADANREYETARDAWVRGVVFQAGYCDRVAFERAVRAIDLELRQLTRLTRDDARDLEALTKLLPHLRSLVTDALEKLARSPL